MCSHYQAIKERERYARHFGVEPPVEVGKHDVWPYYPATFIRRPRQADFGDKAKCHWEIVLSEPFPERHQP